MQAGEILTQLCNLPGPTGFERPAAEAARKLLAPLVDETYVDRMGNLIGVKKCGEPEAKKLLLDAHLDEIGLLVTGVDEGFLRVRNVGGVDARILPNRELTVLCNPPLFGVVAWLPPHVQAEGDYDKAVPLDELYIDIGMTQEEAEACVPIGTPVVYRQTCAPLGDGRITGKALDDRACFAILLRAVELLKDKALDVDLYIMGSTREEIGGAGAKVGTYGINPDFCVAVDVTQAKSPDSVKDYAFTLGGGPVIATGPNMTRALTERMRAKADSKGIAYQVEVLPGRSGTNAWSMQIVREGVASSILSLPLRYMHTPVETLDLGDMEQTAALLAAFAENIGQEVGELCCKL